MSTSGETVVRELGAIYEPLQSLLDEHVDYYDEVLSHVFMGDVMRYLVDASESDDGQESIRPILEFLENRFLEGDEEVKELISVSFVELLPRPGERGERIRGWLGPALTAEAKRIA